MGVGLPEADYFVLASRLIPDRDGGFTISVLRRARDMAETGARVQLLTVDPGSADEHAAHREEWRRRGLLGDDVEFVNLFDDARSDAAWLRAAALSLDALPEPAAGADRRAIVDAAGRTVLELPVIVGDPAWHLSPEPVLIWDAAGTEPMGWLPGFGGLYRAWLNARLAGAMRAQTSATTGAGPRSRDAVVICEARQIGELLVADAEPLLHPDVRVLHTTHACHVLPPYRWDSPMDAAWERWLGIADRFDGVLWLTPSQQDDVERRVGHGIRSAVVPHPAPKESANEPVSGRILMVCSLIPRKRVDDAVRALAQVRATAPAAELHVYGAGPERERLEQLAAELQVADAVVLHGHSSDLSTAWREADVFTLASTNEGQGLVVLEALAHGVPVVSYDIPYGPRDTLAHGGGQLVPDGDVEALAAALRDIIRDRDRRTELSAEARTAAEAMGPSASMSALGVAVEAALSAPVARPGR